MAFKDTKFTCSWCDQRHRWNSVIGKRHIRLIRKNEHKVYKKIAKSLGE